MSKEKTKKRKMRVLLRVRWPEMVGEPLILENMKYK